MSARRSKKDAENNIGIYPEFAWCWPVNRRILYNRASVDPKGQPWDDKQWVIKFAGDAKDGKYTSKKWLGDVPDGGWYPPGKSRWNKACRCQTALYHEKTRIWADFWAWQGRWPLPRALRTPGMSCGKELFQFPHGQSHSGGVLHQRDGHATCDPRFPFVGTTYRVSEHWQTGLMTRPQKWLMELEPNVFVEMSEELAELRGIKTENGFWCPVQGPIWSAPPLSPTL